MYLIKLHILLFCLALFSIQVNAEEFDKDGYTLHYKQCLDNSGGVTVDMLNCKSEELRIQDVLLNIHYKQAMKALDKEQQNNLKEAQRAWLKMREKDSDVIGVAVGGTLGSIVSSSLFLEYTVERIKFLKKINIE